MNMNIYFNTNKTFIGNFNDGVDTGKYLIQKYDLIYNHKENFILICPDGIDFNLEFWNGLIETLINANINTSKLAISTNNSFTTECFNKIIYIGIMRGVL